MSRKLQVALYWGAACGGCDVAVLDTNEFLLELGRVADIRFWPIAVDTKYASLEKMADGELDVALYNGAVRNSENEALARLLRRKAKKLVAVGSCAHLGGIPGLANLGTLPELLSTVYGASPTHEVSAPRVPLAHCHVGIHELELPRLFPRVHTLAQVVDVDWVLPGCPPSPAHVKQLVQALAAGKPPEPGEVVGGSKTALCEECRRTRGRKKVKAFFRPWQVMQDPTVCLLEQGILCAGPATRGGCGVRCPDVGMGCRGCFGPLDEGADAGARLLAALAAVIDSDDPVEIDRILDGLPDLAGLAYRFSLPSSLLQRRHGP